MAESLPERQRDPEGLRREKLVPASRLESLRSLRAESPDLRRALRRRPFLESQEAHQVVGMEEARAQLEQQRAEKDRVEDILDGYDPELTPEQSENPDQTLKKGMVGRVRDWWMNVAYPYLTVFFAEDLDEEKKDDED